MYIIGTTHSNYLAEGRQALSRFHCPIFDLMDSKGELYALRFQSISYCLKISRRKFLFNHEEHMGLKNFYGANHSEFLELIDSGIYKFPQRFNECLHFYPKTLL